MNKKTLIVIVILLMAVAGIVGMSVYSGRISLKKSFSSAGNILMPTITFQGNGSTYPIVTISSGNSAVLSWSTVNANSCFATGAWYGPKSTAGSQSTGNLIASQTYTLTCTNTYGSTVSNVTINILSGTQLPPPPINVCGNGVCEAGETPISCKADCPANPQTLNIFKSGTGTSTITTSPSGILCGTGCSSSFVFGTPVTITVVPNSGSGVANWIGCTPVNFAFHSRTCTVTLNKLTNVTVELGGPKALAVVKSGTGSGIVTSTMNAPLGINCGTLCSHTYNYGSGEWLSALPDTGSSIIGWTGCTYDPRAPRSCYVSSLYSNATVTVTFLKL